MPEPYKLMYMVSLHLRRTLVTNIENKHGNNNTKYQNTQKMLVKTKRIGPDVIKKV